MSERDSEPALPTSAQPESGHEPMSLQKSAEFVAALLGQTRERLGNLEAEPGDFGTRLEFSDAGGFFHVRLFNGLDEAFAEALALVASPAVAERLESLELMPASDNSSDGTFPWVLNPMVMRLIPMPRLRTFKVHGYPDDFLTAVLDGWGYEEVGLAARLLDRMPAVEELWLPSAPNPQFFVREPHPLRRMTICAGYDSQRFINELRGSKCFPRLEELDFTDYHIHEDQFDKSRVPKRDFDWLFRSEDQLPGLRRLTVRATVLQPESQPDLLKTPLGRRLESLVIRTSPEREE